MQRTEKKKFIFQVPPHEYKVTGEWTLPFIQDIFFSIQILTKGSI